MSIYTLFHPPVFQGRNKKENYFEGWYFKMAKQDEVIALIPGIAMGSDRHSFIQVISSREKKSWYVRFPYEAFKAEKKVFSITIRNNHFTIDGISIDLNPTPFPVTLTKPGIMGWYAYVPFMECFHGVVSTHHNLKGSVKLNGKTSDYTGGTGYIEKDWGTSFPSA